MPDDAARRRADPRDYDDALGHSDLFLEFQERLSRVARVNRPVLIIGERGTGKELAARRLHFLSQRWQEPLVQLNCAALTPTLIESELFGHEAGAFTGATRRRSGRFEAANGGTLFLDELGNVPLQVQEKILQVVEYGVFERVGGAEAIHVDVRIVGATNADLPRLAEEGRFMRDLLDRLSFEVLYLPPLRERREDILLLATHFAARMAYELGREAAPQFSLDVLGQLEQHPWRGNVRELKNVVERAVYCAEGNVIRALVFDPFQSPYAPCEAAAKSIPAPTSVSVPLPEKRSAAGAAFKDAVAAFELGLLEDALRAARHNQREAARRLKLSYHQWRGLYRKYQTQLNS